MHFLTDLRLIDFPGVVNGLRIHVVDENYDYTCIVTAFVIHYHVEGLIVAF